MDPIVQQYNKGERGIAVRGDHSSTRRWMHPQVVTGKHVHTKNGRQNRRRAGCLGSVRSLGVPLRFVPAHQNGVGQQPSH